MTALGKTVQGLRCFASDVAQGFFEITHNGFALVGLATVCCVLTLAARPDLRETGEVKLRGWLQARQEAAAGMPIELDAIERATATDPHALPRQQAAIAYWLSKKYRVAPEPLGALVSAAYEIGAKDKTLKIYGEADDGGRIHCSHDYWSHNLPYMLDWLEERL